MANKVTKVIKWTKNGTVLQYFIIKKEKQGNFLGKWVSAGNIDVLRSVECRKDLDFYNKNYHPFQITFCNEVETLKVLLLYG